MPSALAYQPGEYHAQGWELLTAIVCQRSKLSAKLEEEREDPAPVLVCSSKLWMKL